jgi:hypothetical protein
MSQSAKPFVLDFETQQKIDQALSHSSLSVTQRSRIQETIQILQDSAKDQVFGSAGPETPHAVRAELGLDARFKLNSKCQFAWMGYYGHSEHSENNPLLRAYGLAIDPQLYGLASTADRAAFWLHEAIYLLDRQRNEFSIYRGSKTNSRFTRRLVQSLLKISGAPVLSKNAIDRHLGN